MWMQTTKQKNETHGVSFRLFKFSHFNLVISLQKLLLLAGFVFTTILSGCLPQNESLDQSLINTIGKGAAGDSYAGFKGLTSAETVSATKVKLNWDSSTDPTVIAYNIYDVTLMFSPKLVKTVKAPATTITLTNLTTQSYYVFRVRAVDTSQKEDSNVNDIGAIPYGGVLSSEVITSTSAKLTFNDGSDADAINVYCKVGLTALNETKMVSSTDTHKTEITLTNLVQGEYYTCRVVLEVAGFEDNNSVTTQFIPLGQATQLVFTTQPSNSVAGVVFAAQPIVAIQDVNGNTITAGPDSTATIVLTIAQLSPTVGVLRGTATLTAVKGVATFSGLNLQESGIKILTATKSDTSNLTNGSTSFAQNSAQFTITPGSVSATKSSLTITPTVPPANPLAADGNASYSVVFTLKDQYDNPVSGVKPQFTSTISGDTLTQPTTNTDNLGQSTGSISTVIADEIPPYRSLAISSPSGLTGVTTLAPFVAGAASKLSFTVQPVNSPAGLNGIATVQVAVQDANGNIVRTGAAATSSITMNIASIGNGAALTGTATQTAVNGIAAFTGLGIDKTGSGYKLLASSGSFTPAYSNSFNVTAGVPQKIVIAGASTVISGACSTAITVQLQDNGSNPTNAIQSTPLSITGLGSGSLYSSSACTGAALTSTLTFTAGTNTKTVYLKDFTGENIALNIRDSSNVLTTGTRTITVTPNKISLAALMPSPPAVANTPMSIVAGQCSSPIVITPMGDNGQAAPLFTTTTVAITGLNGTSALLYSDAACTNLIADPTNVTLPVTYGGTYPINLYIKDPKAETLSVNISDPNSLMGTISATQPVTITPSKIDFVGPTSVVAGQCSTAFTIKLKDAQGTAVTAAANTTININGLGGSTTGKFYTSPSCSGGGSSTTVTLPSGASSLVVYFSDTTAEALNIYMSDPNAKMANSQTISIGISPAGLQITGPSPANSNTTVCAGPFTVNTLDGAVTPNITAAISTITVNLTTTGYAAGFIDAAKFYSDNVCSNPITSLTFNNGDSAKSFYFVGQYPIAPVTLTATDAGSVLTTGTKNWTVKGATGWLGTLGKIKDSLGNLFWFRTGVKPVSARIDAPRTVRGLHFDSSKQFLYVVDQSGHRILKYDYPNQRYVGWIGRFLNTGNATAPIVGSNVSLYPGVPTSAQCVSTTSGNNTPGWCVGGQAWATGSTPVATTTGGLWDPMKLTDDGTYIYITNFSAHVVTRFNASSGAFDGWIGQISGTPTGNGTGGPPSCASTNSGLTPGWCVGGQETSNLSATGTWGNGNGSMYNPRGIANDGTYLYVGTSGAVLRFLLSNGSFQGWIGKGYTTAPTGGAAGCTSVSNGTTTPGWCTGGTYRQATSGAEVGAGGLYTPVQIYLNGGTLIVLENAYGGYVNKYDTTSGAFLGTFASAAHNWPGPNDMIQDPNSSNIFVADSYRVTAIDSTGVVNGWMGKVANNAAMSAALSNTSDCSILSINSNTPGWCLGGSAKNGMEETSFVNAQALEVDANGDILVGQLTNSAIKKFKATTGQYLGTFVSSSVAPTEWSNDSNTIAEIYGFGDNDFYNPMGSYSDGTYLYVVDGANGRVKKIRLSDGKLIGYIGVVTSSPTDGASPSCLSVNPMSFTSAWCLGANVNPWWSIGDLTGNGGKIDGNLYVPSGIAGDGTYLYVVDQGLSRINKFNASTGAFVGWIGNISSVPTGGATGCTGATVGTFTPGWCTGGNSTFGSGDGMLYYPSAIVYVSGNLYVTDNINHRVSSYVASSGAFNGWIGRTNAAPSSGCTTASNGSYTVSTSGWCKGGSSQQASGPGDRGGGFSFWGTTTAWAGYMNGITSDGTNLYITNYYNQRIDKYSLAGAWLGAARTRWDQYTNTWSNVPATVGGWNSGGCGRPRGLWTDGTYIYGVGDQDCAYATSSGVAIFKLEISSGNVKGWQGGINPTSPSYTPTGGDPGCAGASGSTPGWCQGGASLANLKLGQYYDARYISGDANYIYVTDVSTNRVTRVPK